MNPNGTPKNLRQPWRKGEPSPNPSGRPKRLPISHSYALLADEPIPESDRKVLTQKGLSLEAGATYAGALARQNWIKAIAGDTRAAKEVREAIEGKAGLRPAVPEGVQEVKIRVVYDKESDNSPQTRPGDGVRTQQGHNYQVIIYRYNKKGVSPNSLIHL
jgi:hypothetical protein